MDNTQQHYPPEHLSSWSRPDAKVAIPRLQNINYHLPATARPQRPRTDVVSKAVSPGIPIIIGPELTASSVHSAVSEVGLSSS